MNKRMKDFLSDVVVVIGLVIILFGSITEPRHAKPQPTAFPPPMWTQVPVGGMWLMEPDVADSLGRHPYTVIPSGSVLHIPKIDPGKPVIKRASR